MQRILSVIFLLFLLPQQVFSSVGTSDKALIEVNPSNLDKGFDSNLKKSGVFKQVSMRFPSEALVFYAAIGATMYRQSLTDPHIIGGELDPHWALNFRDHISSPIGLLSFYAFMLANGKTGQLMLKASEKLYIRSYISSYVGSQAGSRVQAHLSQTLRYLSGPMGMSMGMMASRLVEEFYHDPNVRACVVLLKKKFDSEKEKNEMEACDQAFYDWTIHRKVYEWAPDIVSLISASLIASVGLNYLVKKPLSKVLPKQILLNLSQAFSQGSPWGRIATTFVHLYVFLEVDTLLQQSVIRDWKTSRNANDLRKRLEKLSHQMEIAESSQLRSEAAKEDLIFKLRLFGREMSLFRQFRMDKAWVAYQSWSAHVSTFFQQYAFAINFYYYLFENYSIFVDRKTENPFENRDPYFGVLPVEKKKGDVGEWTEESIIAAQKEKILQAAQWTTDKEISPKGLKRLKKIQSLLLAVKENGVTGGLSPLKASDESKSKREDTIMDGLELLNESYRTITFAVGDRKAFKELMIFIGNPNPQRRVGHAYLYVLEKEISEGLEEKGSLNKLLYEMSCGPEEGEPVVRASIKGYIFLPPKITQGSRPIWCDSASYFPIKKAPIRDRFWLSVRENMRKDLLGHAEDGESEGESHFFLWWKKHVDEKVLSSMEKWRNEFNSVISHVFFPIFLQDSTKMGGRSIAPQKNISIPSGVAENLIFELKFWLKIFRENSSVDDDLEYLLKRFHIGIEGIRSLQKDQSGKSSTLNDTWFSEINQRLSEIASQEGIDLQELSALLLPTVSSSKVKDSGKETKVIVELALWHIIKLAEELSMYESFMFVIPRDTRN